MKQINFFILISILFVSTRTFSQIRTERPLQFQLNFSSYFLNSFSNQLADSEVENLDINKWIIPGISAGYFLNNRIYIGYSFQPNRNLILDEKWSYSFSVINDGDISVDHNSGSYHTIESKIFPFKFGLFFSVFLTHVSAADYKMTYTRTNSLVTLGNNQYDTDLITDWNFKALNTIGIGFGFNQVFGNGISFNVALGMPFSNGDNFENIVITPVSNVSVVAADLESATLKLEDETFFYPVHLYLSVGYNFKWIR